MWGAAVLCPLAFRPCDLYVWEPSPTYPLSVVGLETRSFVCFVFICVYLLLIDSVDRVTFCVFGVFSLVCFELSVPVQVIAWKDSSPK